MFQHIYANEELQLSTICTITNGICLAKQLASQLNSCNSKTHMNYFIV